MEFLDVWTLRTEIFDGFFGIFGHGCFEWILRSRFRDFGDV